MISILGWDIGAANVKAAHSVGKDNEPDQIRVASRPFEIWREKDRLPGVLRSVYGSVISDVPPQAMAVTMTAELSDVFATKREGVLFILESLHATFPKPASYVFSVSGEFIPLDQARSHPLEFAASNWLVSAHWLARQHPDCLFIDVGSTTTDIVPIIDGEASVSGRTDLERLSSGELVYTGALRTNLAAIVHSVPVAGKLCRVSSEYFAVSGDVHLILGNLDPGDYACATPDRRAPCVDSARSRLARLVCADVEMLSSAEIDEIARYVYERQVQQIREAIEQVISRLPGLRRRPVITMGSGSFLGAAAATSLGLKIQEAAGDLGRDKSAVVPCIAAAQLLAEHLGGKSR